MAQGGNERMDRVMLSRVAVLREQMISADGKKQKKRKKKARKAGASRL